MMIIVTLLKRKTTQSLVASILIFSMLAGMLSACSLVVSPSQATDRAGEQLTPPAVNSATGEYLSAIAAKVETPTPTLTMTPAPTSTPTEVSELTASLESLGFMGFMDDIVLAPEQVFSDFFSKTIPSIPSLLFNDSNERVNLGGSQMSDGQIQKRADIQMVVLGGFTTDDGVYLLLGIEDQTTGERLLVPVQFTFGFEGPYSTVQVGKDTSQTKKLHYNYHDMKTLDAHGLLAVAEEHLGKVVTFQLLLEYKQEISNEEFKNVIEQYLLIEREESNRKLIEDPSSLDVYDLKDSPWSGIIVF